MPIFSQQEIRDRALSFAKDWKDASREKAEAQTFWNEFFSIFGIHRRRVASFEEPAKKLGNNRGSIDLFWKGTLLVEHKSKGHDLEKAYEQALNYFPGIDEQDLPQYVLVSDFENFRFYGLETNEKHDFTLAELPKKVHLFGFISGYQKRTYHDEDPVNIRVAEKMGQLLDELLTSGYKGHNLERFLVRLIYCLFADNTGIFSQKQYFLSKGWPIISIDVKKKELIGNFKNHGQSWCLEAERVNDHDFKLDASGRAVPYGIYVVNHNKGYVYVGQSADTAEFAVDVLARWWQEFGQLDFPDAPCMMILCDGGGSNGYRLRLWKVQLQKQLADQLGLEITVCHYPTGASKWNPIEHRLFGPISTNWAGKPLRTFEIMLACIRGTTTQTGLQVSAFLVQKVYASLTVVQS